jgi:hypothetical protein
MQNSNTILMKPTAHLDRFRLAPYTNLVTNLMYTLRKQGLCRAPRAHGKGLKTHDKLFAVRFLSGRTTKGAR